MSKRSNRPNRLGNRGSSDWRQQHEGASPGSAKALGAVLLIVCVAGLAGFAYWLLPRKTAKHYVAAVSLVGYGPSRDDAPRLPPFGGPGDNASTILDALTPLELQPTTAAATDVRVSQRLRSWIAQERPEVLPGDTVVLAITGHAMLLPNTVGPPSVHLLTSEHEPPRPGEPAGGDEPTGQEGSVLLSEVLERLSGSCGGTKVLLIDVFRLAADPEIGHYHGNLFDHVDRAVSDAGRDDVWVITACGPNQRAYDSVLLSGRPSERRSVFAESVRRAANNGALSRQKSATLLEFFEAIREETESLSGGLQTPQLLHCSSGEERLAAAADLTVCRRDADPTSQETRDGEGDASPPPETAFRNAPIAEGAPEPPAPKWKEDPWWKIAAYAPAELSAVLRKASPGQGLRLLEDSLSGAAEKANAIIDATPRWETRDPQAEQRRDRREFLLFAAHLVERSVGLCEAAAPYSSRLSRFKRKTDSLAGLLGADPERGLEEIAQQLQTTRSELGKTLEENLFEIESRGFSLEAELTVRAIIDSWVLGRDATHEAQKRLNSLAVAMGPNNGPSREAGSPAITLRDTLALRERLHRLVGNPGAAAPGREDPAAWLLENHHRSLGKSIARRLDADQRRIPRYAKIRLPPEAPLPRESHATLKMELDFGGDGLSPESRVRLRLDSPSEATGLSVQYEGKPVELGVPFEVRVGERFRLEPRLEIRSATPLSEETPLSVRAFFGEQPLQNAPAVTALYDEETPRVRLFVDREDWRSNGWRRVAGADDRQIECYPDLLNRFRLRVENRSRLPRSYGLAVYAVRGRPPTSARLKGPPLAVAYLKRFRGSEVARLGVLPPPPATPADTPDGPPAEPDDAELVDLLRQLAETGATSDEPREFDALAIKVFDDQARPIRGAYLPLKIGLRSPLDYVRTAVLYNHTQDPNQPQCSGTVKFELLDPNRSAPLGEEGLPVTVGLYPTAEPSDITSGATGSRTNRLTQDKTTASVSFTFTRLVEETELPLLQIDIGSYPRARLLRYEPGTRGWVDEREPRIDFLRVLGGKDLAPHALLRGAGGRRVCVASGEETLRYAEFAAYGGWPASTNQRLVEVVNGDREQATGLRSVAAFVKAIDGRLVVTATSSELRVPVSLAPLSSFRKEIRATLRGGEQGDQQAESPLLISDTVPPVVKAVELGRGSSVVRDEKSKDPVPFSVEFSDGGSGVAKVLTYWDSGLNSSFDPDEGEPVSTRIKPGVTTERGFSAELAVDKLPVGVYQLAAKAIDHAGNESLQWKHGKTTTLEIIKPAPRRQAAATTKRSSPPPNKKPKETKPAEPHKLVILVRSENKAISEDTIAVKAQGPEDVTLRRVAGNRWEKYPVKPGVYKVTAKGRLGSWKYASEEKDVKSAERSKARPATIIIKALK